MAQVLGSVSFDMGKIVVIAAPDGSVERLCIDTCSGDTHAGSGGALFEEIQRYLSGQKVRWSFRPDLSSETPFRKAVYERTMEIPYGETATYGRIAGDVGSPGAARAVGQAMANNRFPLVIPCHRVVSGNGSLGGFSSGLEVKRFLLRLEGSFP